MKKSLAAPFVFWLSAELVLFAAFVFADSAAAFGTFIVLLIAAALSYAACFYQRKHISAEVSLPPTAEKNTEISGKLSIKSSSRLPILKLICRLDSHSPQSFIGSKRWVGSCILTQLKKLRIHNRENREYLDYGPFRLSTAKGQ